MSEPFEIKIRPSCPLFREGAAFERRMKFSRLHRDTLRLNRLGREMLARWGAPTASKPSGYIL